MTDGIRAGLARIATDLHTLSSPLDTLSHRFKLQYAVNARPTKAAAKAETELKDLHQTIEALSQQIHEQAELLAKVSNRRLPARAAAMVGVQQTPMHRV